MAPPSGSDPGEVHLNRRTPQANLAPQLRREQQPLEPEAPASPVSPPDAARTRDALSRYQASRRAALAKDDPEGGEEQ